MAKAKKRLIWFIVSIVIVGLFGMWMCLVRAQPSPSSHFAILKGLKAKSRKAGIQYVSQMSAGKFEQARYRSAQETYDLDMSFDKVHRALAEEIKSKRHYRFNGRHLPRRVFYNLQIGQAEGTVVLEDLGQRGTRVMVKGIRPPNLLEKAEDWLAALTGKAPEPPPSPHLVPARKAP